MIAGGEPVGEQGFLIPPTVFEASATRLPLMRGGIRAGHLALPFRDPRRGADPRERGRVRAVGGDLHVEPGQCDAVQNEAQAGLIHVNSQTAGAEVHVPFGGIKASGFGPHEQGRAAIEFYTETVTVYVDP